MSETTAPRWASYVALGDSFTEGLWDLDPAHPDRVRGWADLLAGALSQRRTAAGLRPLRYASLAVRGKLLGQVLDEQLPIALEMRPDLASLVGGGNDILRPGTDVGALAARLEDGVAQLRAAGVDVLAASWFPSGSQARGRPTRSRACVGLARPKIDVPAGSYATPPYRISAEVLRDLWAATPQSGGPAGASISGMALSPLLEAPTAAAVTACPDLTWDPLPEPDQVDVNGTLLWHPAPEVVVKARRIYGDRWEVLTTSGTTTQARVVRSTDVARLVDAARG